MKILALLFYLVFLPLLSCAQQIEEGWRWKKSFVVQNYSFDKLHDEMSDAVTDIKKTFEQLASDLASF